MGEVDVSVIIVTWNVGELAKLCIRSLQASTSISFDNSLELSPGTYQGEIIVLDSASTDHTCDLLSTIENITFLPQSENIGFARCNNIGAKLAQGRFILLLNPDTEVQPGTLYTLISYMDQHSEVGVAGPHILKPDGSTQLMPRKFPTILGTIFELPYLELLTPWYLLEQENFYNLPAHQVISVDWVLGCALMTRKELYSYLGGLDEDYKMYAEEKDFCKQIKLLSKEVSVVTDARITHHGGKSSAQNAIVLHREYWASNLRYCYKYWAAPAAFVLHLIVIGWYLCLYLVLLTNTFWRVITNRRTTSSGSNVLLSDASNNYRYHYSPHILANALGHLIYYLFAPKARSHS